jgi:hypothetical protein
MCKFKKSCCAEPEISTLISEAESFLSICKAIKKVSGLSNSFGPAAEQANKDLK